MTAVDPFERLIAADPAKRFEPASPHSDEAWAIYNKVIAAAAAEPASEPPRRWVWALLALAAVVTTAAAYVVTRDVDEPLDIGCFREALFPGSDAVALPASVDTPAEVLCREVWEPGGEFAEDTGGTVPPLATCVLDTGIIGVFPHLPNADVCARLGAAEPDPASIDANRAIIELADAIAAPFRGRCLDLAAATAVVQGEFDERGLSDWRVIVTVPASPERPCASLAFDVPAKTVELVFVEAG